jgi:DNA-binding LytR/AlgR family response regulator
MTRVFIIEDEAPARERLAALIATITSPCTVAGSADSVATAGRWLRANPAPDLIFADIQLGDGLSLELFKTQPPPCPIVFTTAHDDYLLEAFAAQGIAYLLKPVNPDALAAAVAKYHQLGRHFTGNLAALAATVTSPARRQRILAQRGPSFQPVAIADIAYFFSENKLTFLVTRTGEKCLVNEPLTVLAGELDPAQFFRVNRNYLVHAAAVKSFSPVGKGRLAVQLAPRTAEEVQVSQENAADFRAWAGR